MTKLDIWNLNYNQIYANFLITLSKRNRIAELHDLFLTEALVLDSFPYQSLKLECKFRLTALGLQTLNADYFYQTIISFKIKIY